MPNFLLHPHILTALNCEKINNENLAKNKTGVGVGSFKDCHNIGKFIHAFLQQNIVPNYILHPHILTVLNCEQ